MFVCVGVCVYAQDGRAKWSASGRENAYIFFLCIRLHSYTNIIFIDFFMVNLLLRTLISLSVCKRTANMFQLLHRRTWHPSWAIALIRYIFHVRIPYSIRCIGTLNPLYRVRRLLHIRPISKLLTTKYFFFFFRFFFLLLFQLIHSRNIFIRTKYIFTFSVSPPFYSATSSSFHSFSL